MQPKTNRGYFAKFLKFKTDTYTFGRDYFIYVFKKETSAAIWGGGGVQAHTSHPLSPPKGPAHGINLGIELKPHWWEASARSQLLHPCSLLLSIIVKLLELQLLP